jgi:hypothetical protein
VVRRDGPERIGGELGAELGAHVAQFPEFLDDGRIVLRTGDRGHAGRVSRRRAQQGGATDLDQLDGLLDADDAAAHLDAERLDVDGDQVDRGDALVGQLGHLIGTVPARENPGVHRRMERLDLAPQELGDVGQFRYRVDLDAVRGQVLAGAVRREDLDVELLEIAGKAGNSFPVGD